MTDILRLATPLTLWLAAFSGIYGLQGLVCSPRWEQAGLDAAAGRGALLLAGALALALQGGLLLVLRRTGPGSSSAFVRRISLTLSAIALAATLWTLLPVLATSVCL